MSRDFDLDLGHGVTLSWTCWKPDRALNAQYVGIPDIERLGAIFDHPNPKTETGRCTGAINFDTPEARRVLSERSLWQVESWDPLTISPSVLCRGRNIDGSECGFHGWIRGGKWVPA